MNEELPGSIELFAFFVTEKNGVNTSFFSKVCIIVIYFVLPTILLHLYSLYIAAATCSPSFLELLDRRLRWLDLLNGVIIFHIEKFC